MVIAIACVIAAAIPLAVMFGFYKLDLYKTGEFRILLVCFAAGVLAYFGAALINPIPLRQGWIDHNQMVRYLAPVVEEILKGLVLFFLVRRPKFKYFVDGALYGFTIGIGFAIVENLEYIFGSPGAALASATNRVVSTNLMHAAASATVGIVMGWARFKKPLARSAFSIGGLLLAMALHTGFNNLVTRVESGWLLLYAVIMGAGAAGLIALMMRRGFKEEQLWIQETLGINERVEKEEMAAVQDIANVNKVMKRIEDTFDQATAEKIKRLLIIQANLGIQKKSAEKMSDEKLRLEINRQADELRKEMESIRREIGSYAMAYLRYTHLDEMFSVYALLGERLQEAAAQPKKAGPSLYERLGQRMVVLTKDQPENNKNTGEN